jgi:hypothetical protein
MVVVLTFGGKINTLIIVFDKMWFHTEASSTQ